jgi:hypothetical protein
MTRTEHVVRGTVASDHIVQFFDSTASLADGVGAFLSPAFRQNAPCLIVARPRHSKAIGRALHTLGCSLANAQRDGLLTILDADTTLKEFMRDGRPDSMLFHQTVGALVEPLVKCGGQLRIYGEMVDMLAAQGNFHAAHCLEELWNQLARRLSFALLCGYSAAHFATDTTRETLAAICREHTQVRLASDNASSDKVA